MLSRRVRLITALFLPIVLVAALVSVVSGTAGARRASLAGVPRASSVGASKPYTAKLSYDESNHGHQHGQTTVGIVGHGAFSAKLGPGAALDAALIALATGVPVNKISQGGTYVVSRQIAGNGDVSGMAVAKFKARGLGTVCLSYVETPGVYAGAGFVPMSGSIKTVGGTGLAASWRARLGFRQNSLSGTSVEQFGASGSEHASTGAPKRMTAACKRVAALAKP